MKKGKTDFLGKNTDFPSRLSYNIFRVQNVQVEK